MHTDMSTICHTLPKGYKIELVHQWETLVPNVPNGFPVDETTRFSDDKISSLYYRGDFEIYLQDSKSCVSFIFLVSPADEIPPCPQAVWSEGERLGAPRRPPAALVRRVRIACVRT